MQESQDKVWKQILEWLQNANDVVSSELPVFIHEFVSWCIAKHIFFIVLGVLSLIASFIFYKVFCKVLEDSSVDDPTAFLSIMGGIITFILGCAAVSINTYYLVMVLVAPRVYLIETVMDYVKR